MGKKLNIKANIKKATNKTEVKQDMTGLIAIPLYLIPATILRLSGWTGLIASFAVTWFTGAMFDIPSVRRNAWGMAGLHLVYGQGSGMINNLFGAPPWQIQGTGITGLRGLRGMGAYNTPYNHMTLPDGSGNSLEIMARPAEAIEGNSYQGVSGYQMANEAPDVDQFDFNADFEL